MQATSTTSRILGAALAVLCSSSLLVVVGERMNPARLAVAPQVMQMEAVVITAPAPSAASLAAAAARTAAN